jgi:citrate lyase subunit beta / citryl-CoA lyase
MNFLKAALGNTPASVGKAAKAGADLAQAVDAVFDQAPVGFLTAKARIAQAKKRLPPRSVLFVPGSNPKAMAKAAKLNVDAIILDLEDAVPPEQKFEARDRIANAILAGELANKKIIVRVNSPRASPQWGFQDLDMCGSIADKIHGVALPKTEAGDDKLFAEHFHPNHKIWAFIETPRGVLKADEILSSGAYEGVAMGNNDLAAELKLPLTPPPNANVTRRFGLFSSLSQVILAARANGLFVLDGVFNDLNDLSAFKAECIEGRMMGFDGKTLIHPSQIEPCMNSYLPSAEELKWAQRVLQEVDQTPEAIGAISVEGKLVEELHIRRAAEIVAVHESVQDAASTEEKKEEENNEFHKTFRTSAQPKRNAPRNFDHMKNEKWENSAETRIRMPPS